MGPIDIMGIPWKSMGSKCLVTDILQNILFLCSPEEVWNNLTEVLFFWEGGELSL